MPFLIFFLLLRPLTTQDGTAPNNAVTFRILFASPPSAASLFSIDPSLGAVATTAALDRVLMPVIVLTITATDGGTPALFNTSFMVVYVMPSNRYAPVFAPSFYSAAISEV